MPPLNRALWVHLSRSPCLWMTPCLNPCRSAARTAGPGSRTDAQPHGAVPHLAAESQETCQRRIPPLAPRDPLSRGSLLPCWD